MVAVSVFPGGLGVRGNRSDKSRKQVAMTPGLTNAYPLTLGGMAAGPSLGAGARLTLGGWVLGVVCPTTLIGVARCAEDSSL